MIIRPSLKDKKRINYFFLLLTITFILNTKIILGATNNTAPLPPFPTNAQVTSSTDISNTIIQENIKTRMEIKQYCDQKIAGMIDAVKTEGADIVGKNFAEFDKRIHDLAQKLFIKLVIATFTTILLAELLYYIIKRRVEKKHMPRAMTFKEVSVSPTQIGLIAQPKTANAPPPPFIQPPQETQPSQGIPSVPLPPQNNILPLPDISPLIPQQIRELPTFPELQQPILLSPREREKIIREQEGVNEMRRKEAEKKLAKLIDEHNKNLKERKKLKKKLDKPEQIKSELLAEHENLQKEIEMISKTYGFVIPKEE